MAYVANSLGRGIYLREAPAGSVIGYLPEGAPLRILEGHEIINRIEWVEVEDQYGRTGWIVSYYIVIRP